MGATRIAHAGEPEDPGRPPEPLASWYARRRYRSEDYPPQLLAQCKGERTVTVIVPTRECAATIGGVLEDSVGPLAEHGLVDELVVVDAGSADGTAAAARRAGARVLFEDELDAQLGPALGKGDAMWRALRATGGEIVCFLDGDTADPTPYHLQGLLGPLLVDNSLALVKGAFDRPLDADGVKFPHEGGRVTELMARPLLNLHEPLLAGFAQPLAGEFSARRALLERCRFPVGYGVEIAILIDGLRARGLDALAECQLGPVRTVTNRCGRSARWRTRCWPRSSTGLPRRSGPERSTRMAVTCVRGKAARSLGCRCWSVRRSARRCAITYM
jgi:glucosyl-3-phosphoglycerate synthase